MQDGRFREDLFYRLNVFRLAIPPLRERRDEVPALVHHFVARAATEFGKGRLRVAEETMEHLVMFPWPGNVRQLQNELRSPKMPPRAPGSPELAVPLRDKLMPTLAHSDR